MGAEQQYIDLFERHRRLIDGRGAPLLNALRREAMDAFKAQGFPTRSQEAYRYTDINQLLEPDYGMNIGRIDIPVNPYDVFKCDVPHMGTAPFFMINDAFHAHRSSKSSSQPLPPGVIVDSLRNAALEHGDLLKGYYGRLADVQADGIAAFNTAFVQDGVFIYIPRNTVVDCPLQLVNVLKADVDMLLNRRVLIVLGSGAQLRLLVCDHSLSDQTRVAATQVIEAFVGENASLDLYELEETHEQSVRIGNLYVRQEAGSRVVLNGMTLSNGVSRNTTRVCMAGSNAELSLSGMVVASRRQKVDNSTFVDHQVPYCTSRQLYKYVLDEQAVGAYSGLVTVRPGSHHTRSMQTNRNLCATRQARMYTQPQLEIYNDDVQCSHGATVGQLDEQALFYMQQRGLPLHEARLLLMLAFVNDVVDQVRIDALRERIHVLVEKRFRGELNKGCRGCDLCHNRV